MEPAASSTSLRALMVSRFDPPKRTVTPVARNACPLPVSSSCCTNVLALVPKNLNHQIGTAIDDFGIAIERWRAIDHPEYLQDFVNLI